MKQKLLGTQHYLNIYRNSDKDIEKEIRLNVPLDGILEIVLPKDDDPLLYDGYILNERQIKKIIKRISEDINVDFEKYFYVLECEGIYE